MKNSKIYRLAAERIADGKEDYCCVAISIVQGFWPCSWGWTGNKALKEFLKLYELGDGFRTLISPNLKKLWSFGSNYPEIRQRRVFMLLFAAEEAAAREKEGELLDGTIDESAII
jgi:hypothetical protein